MPILRQHAAARVLNGKLYLAGGYWDDAPTARTDVYDPGTGSWTRLEDMPAPRLAAGSANVGGMLMVFGGINYGGYLKSSVAFMP
jgi:N-acetylneuraminic acid mutarotase